MRDRLQRLDVSRKVQRSRHPMLALLAPMVLLCAFQAGAASDLVVAGERRRWGR